MPYSVLYAIAWLNVAVGGVAGVLVAAFLAAHPTWLTQDMALTCGIIVPASLFLATLLPAVTRTPAQREANYLAALAGALPDDIADKRGLMVTQTPSGTLNVSTPEKPLDTLR